VRPAHIVCEAGNALRRRDECIVSLVWLLRASPDTPTVFVIHETFVVIGSLVLFEARINPINANHLNVSELTL
jgi:hypothetical protein